jgi:hypothetical protein
LGREFSRHWKYAVTMGSGVMAYISSFIMTGSGIQKLLRGHILMDTDSRVVKQVYSHFLKIRKLR